MQAETIDKAETHVQAIDYGARAVNSSAVKSEIAPRKVTPYGGAPPPRAR
jgi:hypothetical protein